MFVLVDGEMEKINAGDKSGTPLTQNKREYQMVSCEFISGSMTEGKRAGERGGMHWRIKLEGSSFYRNQYCGVGQAAGNGRNFFDANTKNWHEPIYIVSICNLFNEPLQGQNVEYISTGHIQQLKSIFHMSQGVGFKDYLVDERWEDCIPDLEDQATGLPLKDSRNPSASTDYWKYHRFVHVADTAGNERKWVNVTYWAAAAIDSVLLDIKNNGVAIITDGLGNTDSVYGVYRHENSGQYVNKNEQFQLIFDDSVIFDNGLDANDYLEQSFIVPAGFVIYIKYDKRIPIRVMGGDAHIGESLMVIADCKYRNEDSVPFISNRFDFDLPIPYNEFRINERMIQVNRPSGINKVQDNNRDSFYRGFALNNSAYLRQWLAHYISMARTPIEAQYMKPSIPNSVNQYYPLVSYRMRPFNWNTNVDDNIWQDYLDDFGQESDQWQWGGFRFNHTINQDYAQENKYHSYVAKPIAFQEETDFCTRIIWSEIKPINIKDSPNVRTFPTLNFFDISDDTGEIKYAYDTEGTRGSNLYAITDSGVCVLITDKRILTEVSGQELATMGSEQQGVQKQVWIEKTRGMTDEMWRTAGESDNALFYANMDSVYMLAGDKVEDIGRIKYYNKLHPILSNVGVGYTNKVQGAYDRYHKEYWITFDQTILGDTGRYNKSYTFAFNPKQKHWIGGLEYLFDKYLCMDDATMYGMKNGEVYELNKGNVINGSPLDCFVITASSPKQPTDKEFTRIRINSDGKPTKVDFYTDMSQYEANTPVASLNTVTNPLALKNYYGWEQYIPRRSDNTNRLQGRMMLYKIDFEDSSEFTLVDTEVQYKELK